VLTEEELVEEAVEAELAPLAVQLAFAAALQGRRAEALAGYEVRPRRRVPARAGCPQWQATEKLAAGVLRGRTGRLWHASVLLHASDALSCKPRTLAQGADCAATHAHDVACVPVCPRVCACLSS